jgi:hypothetical protein
MFKLDEIDELFRCLLSDIPATTDSRKDGVEQSQQLLSAFNKIEDPRLRRELVLLIEILSQMPEVLQRRRERCRKIRPAARMH